MLGLAHRDEGHVKVELAEATGVRVARYEPFGRAAATRCRAGFPRSFRTRSARHSAAQCISLPQCSRPPRQIDSRTGDRAPRSSRRQKLAPLGRRVRRQPRDGEHSPGTGVTDRGLPYGRRFRGSTSQTSLVDGMSKLVAAGSPSDSAAKTNSDHCFRINCQNLRDQPGRRPSQVEHGRSISPVAHKRTYGIIRPHRAPPTVRIKPRASASLDVPAPHVGDSL